MIWFDDHRRARRWIQRDLDARLSARRQGRLREHLRSCARCRAEYDRLHAAFRVLARAPISAIELDQVGHWLDAEVVPAHLSTPRWIAALALAAASVAAIWLVRPVETPEEFAPRGAAPASLAIEALCGRPPRPAGVDGCELDETVTFAWRAGDDAFEMAPLALFGVGVDGGVLYYAPTPIEPEPAISGDGTWTPAPFSAELAVNHAPGPVRVYAVACDAPPDVADVDRWAEALRDARPAESGDPPWIERLSAADRGAVCPTFDPFGTAETTCAAAETTFELHAPEPQ